MLIILLLSALASWLFVSKKENKNLLENEISKLQKEKQELQARVDKLNKTLDQKNEEIKKKDELIEAHKILIASLRKHSETLEKEYSGMLRAVDEAAKSVELFKKKAEADKMLLAKYSKVFFLNEHYKPKSLSLIPTEWTYQGKVLQIRTEVLPFLLEMLQDMKRAGLNPKIFSAYRSFYEQKYLKGAYLQKYGKGANAFSADQGYSEHQLGTTIDISNPDTGLKIRFENTDEFKWLKQNAWKYGFILSYPKNNKYYIYEPWHWRFVGKKLAKKLHDENKHFYDLDQNEIYDYLIYIFDK